MLKVRCAVYTVLLTASSLAMLSCQAGNSDENRLVSNARQRALKGAPEPHPWPGAYPRPTGLRGLGTVTLMVYADREVPADRIAAGPFANEIRRRIMQELRPTGIALANENEAESVLSINMYLVCGAGGPACG